MGQGVITATTRFEEICPAAQKCYKTKSLVRPQLEYGATIWDPYTYANSTEVEAVQGRAARFCFNNYRQISSVSSMMQDLGWETSTEQNSNVVGDRRGASTACRIKYGAVKHI